MDFLSKAKGSYSITCEQLSSEQYHNKYKIEERSTYTTHHQNENKQKSLLKLLKSYHKKKKSCYSSNKYDYIGYSYRGSYFSSDYLGYYSYRSYRSG